MKFFVFLSVILAADFSGVLKALDILKTDNLAGQKALMTTIEEAIRRGDLLSSDYTLFFHAIFDNLAQGIQEGGLPEGTAKIVYLQLRTIAMHILTNNMNLRGVNELHRQLKRIESLLKEADGMRIDAIWPHFLRKLFQQDKSEKLLILLHFDAIRELELITGENAAGHKRILLNMIQTQTFASTQMTLDADTLSLVNELQVFSENLIKSTHHNELMKLAERSGMLRDKIRTLKVRGDFFAKSVPSFFIDFYVVEQFLDLFERSATEIKNGSNHGKVTWVAKVAAKEVLAVLAALL